MKPANTYPEQLRIKLHGFGFPADRPPEHQMVFGTT
jgi:hypothetical protein